LCGVLIDLNFRTSIKTDWMAIERIIFRCVQYFLAVKEKNADGFIAMFFLIVFLSLRQLEAGGQDSTSSSPIVVDATKPDICIIMY
jgi:hypothetical protein